MRDNFEAGWPRREGAYRAKRLNDKVKMTKLKIDEFPIKTAMTSQISRI